MCKECYFSVLCFSCKIGGIDPIRVCAIRFVNLSVSLSLPLSSSFSLALSLSLSFFSLLFVCTLSTLYSRFRPCPSETIERAQRLHMQNVSLTKGENASANTKQLHQSRKISVICLYRKNIMAECINQSLACLQFVWCHIVS